MNENLRKINKISNFATKIKKKKKMERKTAYSDYIVRIPNGGDASKLSSLSQSMGWIVVSLDQGKTIHKSKENKGLASLRGILKSSDETSYDEMLREALSQKYNIEL